MLVGFHNFRLIFVVPKKETQESCTSQSFPVILRCDVKDQALPLIRSQRCARKDRVKAFVPLSLTNLLPKKAGLGPEGVLRLIAQ
jgi:hypothetical protein